MLYVRIVTILFSKLSTEDGYFSIYVYEWDLGSEELVALRLEVFSEICNFVDLVKF